MEEEDGRSWHHNIKPSPTKPNQTKPNQTKSNQIKSNQTKTNQNKNNYKPSQRQRQNKRRVRNVCGSSPHINHHNGIVIRSTIVSRIVSSSSRCLLLPQLLLVPFLESKPVGGRGGCRFNTRPNIPDKPRVTTRRFEQPDLMSGKMRGNADDDIRDLVCPGSSSFFDFGSTRNPEVFRPAGPV